MDHLYCDLINKVKHTNIIIVRYLVDESSISQKLTKYDV